jgi:hypothetical protein
MTVLWGPSMTNLSYNHIYNMLVLVLSMYLHIEHVDIYTILLSVNLVRLEHGLTTKEVPVTI